MATNFNFRFSRTGSTEQPYVKASAPRTFQRLINLVRGAIGGALTGNMTAAVGTTAEAASGTLTCAAATGEVGGAINGVDVLVDAVDVDDGVTATAWAAQANANVTVAAKVTAVAAAEKVTITADAAGTAGNSYTLNSATGTGVTTSNDDVTYNTANKSFAGGVAAVKAKSLGFALDTGSGDVGVEVNDVPVVVAWAVGDAATVTALIAAINAHPVVGLLVQCADIAATAFTLEAVTAGAAANTITVAPSGTGMTYDGDVVPGTLADGTAGVTAVAAKAYVKFTNASGTVGATVDGTALTRAASDTDDALTAAAIAAAINAETDALVSKHVVATSAAKVVTVTSSLPGYAGNAVTLAAAGTGSGITASGDRLAGGSETQETFTF